jgi:uncharacterized protein (DUF58 family)
LWIRWAAAGAGVSRRLDDERVLEGQPLEARIVVRRGPLGLPGGEVLDPFAGGAIALSAATGRTRAAIGRPRAATHRPPASLLTGRPRPPRVSELRVVARFPRRGRWRFEPPALALADPLGLARVRKDGDSGSQSLLVLPRTERLTWLRRDSGQRFASPGGPASLDALAATEVDGLRPYRLGTPASRISWPALARGAGLLERRLRMERDSGPLVVLDVRAAADGEYVDAAVRAAASLTLALGQLAGCELLLPGDRRPLQIEPDLGSWAAAHARLAVIDGGAQAPPPSIPTRPRAGAIFYVAAEPGRVPAPLLGAGERGAVLVLPRELAPSVRCAPSFEVSGCRGYLVAAAGRAAPLRERAA